MGDHLCYLTYPQGTTLHVVPHSPTLHQHISFLWGLQLEVPSLRGKSKTLCSLKNKLESDGEERKKEKKYILLWDVVDRKVTSLGVTVLGPRLRNSRYFWKYIVVRSRLHSPKPVENGGSPTIRNLSKGDSTTRDPSYSTRLLKRSRPCGV